MTCHILLNGFALKFNLQLRLHLSLAFSVSPELVAMAKESRDIVMRSMVTIPLAKFDSIVTRSKTNKQVQEHLSWAVVLYEVLIFRRSTQGF